MVKPATIATPSKCVIHACRKDTIIESIPATNPDPVDVCGAGDQVLATLGVMLAEGNGFFEAARVANIAAGLKCAKHGTTPVSRSELDDALRAILVAG